MIVFQSLSLPVRKVMTPDQRLISIFREWAGVFRKFAGKDDVVYHICPECSYEDRNGHAPLCISAAASDMCKCGHPRRRHSTAVKICTDTLCQCKGFVKE